MKDYVPCLSLNCGGRKEHDIRTGEVYPCDVCGEDEENALGRAGRALAAYDKHVAFELHYPGGRSVVSSVETTIGELKKQGGE